MKAVGYFEREVVFVLLEQENVGASTVKVNIHDLNLGYLTVILFVILIANDLYIELKQNPRQYADLIKANLYPVI